MKQTPQARVARDLTEILHLSKALTDQAIQQARDRLMPGGLAMVSLAPVASPAEFVHLLDDAEMWARAAQELWGGEVADYMPRNVEVYMPEDEDLDKVWVPPLQLLRSLSEPLRAARGMTTIEMPVRGRGRQAPVERMATIESEARFLRWALDAGALSAADEHVVVTISRARLRLEDILHAGTRGERTRVLCDRPACEKHPRLVRKRAVRETAAWECCGCGGRVELNSSLAHCPNPWCWSAAPPKPVWASDLSKDRYRCPSCKAWFDRDAFKRAYAKQLRSEYTGKYLSFTDALSTLKALGRSERLVYSWVAPIQWTADRCLRCRREQDPGVYTQCPEEITDKQTGEVHDCNGRLRRVWSSDPDDIVEGYCELKTRRRMVWWPDLWRRHLETQTRQRLTRGKVGA
jgi:hypothetical protein